MAYKPIRPTYRTEIPSIWLCRPMRIVCLCIAWFRKVVLLRNRVLDVSLITLHYHYWFYVNLIPCSWFEHFLVQLQRNIVSVVMNLLVLLPRSDFYIHFFTSILLECFITNNFKDTYIFVSTVTVIKLMNL